MNKRPESARKRALELLSQGLSERDVMAVLEREGIHVSKGSVNNWRRAAAGNPASKAPRTAPSPAAPTKPAKPTKGDRRDKGTAIPEDWDGVDLLHLPVVLLEATAKKLTAKIIETLTAKQCDYTLLGKLVQTQQIVDKELILARPAEKPDPETDPLNLSARDELRERLTALREEAEVTPPAIEAIRAHLAELERRATESAPKVDDAAA